MKSISVFLALCFWLGLTLGSAFAACVPINDARVQVDDIPGAVMTELDGSARAAAVDLFNTFAPPDAPATDTAAMVDLPNGDGFLAAGKDGELCGLVRFNPQQWRVLRISILGRDA
jgi:hypothetical protein